MGYFSNGSEGMDYEHNYCSKCYWGDKACMIWLAHLEYQGDGHDKILDLFIPRAKDGLSNEICTMFMSNKWEQ